MLSDLRFALRQLVKFPGFSLVVVLTLAFGISVNTTIFGMVKQMLLQRPAVPAAERLVLVLQRSEAWNMPHGPSFPDFQDYRERARSVRDLFAYMPGAAHLSAEGGSPERVWIEIVTPNAFQAFGVPAALGRTLLPSDGEAKGAAPVVVLSYDCWRQRFGGDPSLVGRAIILNGHPFTVVGVAREGFHAFSPLLAMSAFVPTGCLDSLRENGAGILEWRTAAGAFRVMGRLSPGATLASARAEAAVITSQLVREYPDSHHNVRSEVIPESHARPDPVFADFLVAFTILFIALVALVLFIACANVANLMFARLAARQKELTLRGAIGASRGRLVRQMLAESVVFAAIAGLVAWVITDAAGQLLIRFAPRGDFPIQMAEGTRWQDAIFTAAISLVAGLASGILPALRASRINLMDNLKEGTAGGAAGGRHRMRNVFVVNQVTFSLVVLFCAGLFLRSLQRLRAIDLGFEPRNLLLMSFDLGLQGYNAERGQVFQRQLLERVRALPGVARASLTTHVPFDVVGLNGRDIWPDTPPPQMKEGNTSVGLASVAPGYFELMGLRLRKGRTLAETDTAAAPRVAVINQVLADLCWPGQEALGRRFRPWRDGPWIEVVGITATAKYVMLAETPRPFFYETLAQEYSAPCTLLVRTSGDPAAMTGSLREVVRGLDAHLPLYNERTMEDLMGSSALAYLPMRMAVTLVGAQGIIALVLAMMGLYAVVAFGVVQRTREIGIRMALGADAHRVVRFVVHEGLRLTVIGLAIGLVLAVAAGLGLSRMLYGLRAVDPLVIGGVTVLLFAISWLACYWPARRSTKVDPVIALRAE